MLHLDLQTKTKKVAALHKGCLSNLKKRKEIKPDLLLLDHMKKYLEQLQSKWQFVLCLGFGRTDGWHHSAQTRPRQASHIFVIWTVLVRALWPNHCKCSFFLGFIFSGRLARVLFSLVWHPLLSEVESCRVFGITLQIARELKSRRISPSLSSVDREWPPPCGCGMILLICALPLSKYLPI
jgi:hypothetical protein